MSSIASQVDYSKIPYSRPLYKLLKLTQQTGGQTVLITAAGGIDSTFDANQVINFSKSFLNFSITPVAGGALNYNYAVQDCIAPIRQIQVYTRGGLYLCDINEVGNYSKIVLKPEIPLKEFLTYPKFAETLIESGPGQYLCRSNSLQNCNTQTLLNPYALRYDGTNSDLAYTEPKYLEPGLDINNIVPQLNIQLPLHMFKNSLLSLNKDLYFNEILQFKIIWAATSKMYFLSTSDADPTQAPAAGAAYSLQVNVAALNLYLAVQSNESLANSIKSQVMTSGMSLLIPYVYYFKNNPGVGTSHAITIRLSRAHGIRCQKIYHSAFHATESGNTVYDNGNVDYLQNIDGAKVGQFYTQLDDMRLQEINLNCGTFDDYMMLREKLKGSVLQSRNMFYYNWFWLEDFSGADKKTFDKYDNLETGIDLSSERKWTFNTLSLRDGVTATAYNYYTYAVCQKLLSISPSYGIMLA